MKLNFWQALGIVLVIVGVILLARSRISREDTVTPSPRGPGTTTAPTAPIIAP